MRTPDPGEWKLVPTFPLELRNKGEGCSACGTRPCIEGCCLGKGGSSHWSLCAAFQGMSSRLAQDVGFGTAAFVKSIY